MSVYWCARSCLLICISATAACVHTCLQTTCTHSVRYTRRHDAEKEIVTTYCFTCSNLAMQVSLQQKVSCNYEIFISGCDSGKISLELSMFHYLISSRHRVYCLAETLCCRLVTFSSGFHFVDGGSVDEQSAFFCVTHVQLSTDGAAEAPHYLVPLLPPFLPIDVIMATNWWSYWVCWWHKGEWGHKLSTTQ